jgi:hypothetical protein
LIQIYVLLNWPFSLGYSGEAGRTFLKHRFQGYYRFHLLWPSPGPEIYQKNFLYPCPHKFKNLMPILHHKVTQHNTELTALARMALIVSKVRAVSDCQRKSFVQRAPYAVNSVRCGCSTQLHAYEHVLPPSCSEREHSTRAGRHLRDPTCTHF